MRENESEKEEVMEAIAADVQDDLVDHEADDADEGQGSEIDESDEESYDDDELEEDEIDIGSYIGLVLEDEEVFGTIIEFDDDEGLVTIEEDGTGDLVTGYQDDMFLED